MAFNRGENPVTWKDLMTFGGRYPITRHGLTDEQRAARGEGKYFARIK